MAEVEPLSLGDVDWATEKLSLRARVTFPLVPVSLSRIREELRNRIAGALHYCARTHDSLLVTSAGPIPFAERRMATIEALVVDRAGDGAKLLRAYRRWFDDRPAIRGIAWAILSDPDPRLQHFMTRLGFVKRGSTYQLWRTL